MIFEIGKKLILDYAYIVTRGVIFDIQWNPMAKVKTGLDVLVADKVLQKQFKGNVALLCHNASIDQNCTHALMHFHQIFGDRFVKIFGPQHGYTSDTQDNMIETEHGVHPYLNIPVYSLYSETRVPTDEMLSGIDHLFVDVQDIGSRPYTYVYTLTLLLEKCSSFDLQVIVLDRPNPINGVTLEGNILEPDFESFIGRHPLPMRHGLTLGELALMHQRYWLTDSCNLKVIKMQNWDRRMYFEETGLPWVLPSPNIARPETCLTFPSIVLFEGTNLSEGRGSVQALELIGHPKIEPFKWFEQKFKKTIKQSGLKGFTLRQVYFKPTFDKFKDTSCGGLQLHVTDRSLFQPWRVGQLLLRETFHYMKNNFAWRNPPFEYNEELLPIDLLNGSAAPRKWVIENNTLEALNYLEDIEEYKQQRNEIMCY